MNDLEELDLVVVGAGWSGLAAAKIFHELNPEKSLAVMESAPTLGGTWASHRLYAGLKTNCMLGTYEYPDFPMDTKTFGVKPGEHIPGPVVHKYLEAYAEKFGVSNKIRFESRVSSAEHQASGGWLLTINWSPAGFDILPSKSESKMTKIFAKKLIVATGLTSEPFLPHFDGQESFGAPLFHGKDFAKYTDTFQSAKRVTVFGGTKTAWDAVYAYATRGIPVDWVIRESGHGPVWMSPPYVTPLKRWLEKLVNTRLLTWFSPCIWGDADGFGRIRSFWHGTAVGRAITDTFWAMLGNDVIALNKYGAHPGTAKLQPWSHAMFTACSFSIMNYDTDFFDLIRNGTVEVHIADVTGLSSHAVHLSNGATLNSDAMCAVTGWKHLPPLKFLPEGIDQELGIPHTPSPSDPKDLVERADKEILERFPRLKRPPVLNKNFIPLTENKGISTTDAAQPNAKLTPYSLYRFLVPASSEFLKHRDIAFTGFMMNFSNIITAHIQGLWVAAYFAGTLPLPDWTDRETFDKIKYETVLHNRFGKWRYPAGHGSQFPDFVFDAMPYLDSMLLDLGLKIHRKNGAFAEALEPYGPEDYTNVVAEWVEISNK